MTPNNAFERTGEAAWAASGRGTVIVPGRSTRSVGRPSIKEESKGGT